MNAKVSDKVIRKLNEARHLFLDEHFEGRGGSRGQFVAWGHVLAAIDALEMEEYDFVHERSIEMLTAADFAQDKARASMPPAPASSKGYASRADWPVCLPCSKESGVRRQYAGRGNKAACAVCGRPTSFVTYRREAPAAAGPLVAPTPGEWSVESHLGAHEDTVKVTPERLLASQPLVKPAPTPEPARSIPCGPCLAAAEEPCFSTGGGDLYCADRRRRAAPPPPTDWPPRKGDRALLMRTLDVLTFNGDRNASGGYDVTDSRGRVVGGLGKQAIDGGMFQLIGPKVVPSAPATGEGAAPSTTREDGKR